MKKIIKIAFVVMILLLAITIFSSSVNAAKVINKNGVTITKISNPDRGEREVDGLVEGGDRENSYTWRLAERGDYIYIATTRNIASSIVNSFGAEFSNAGISQDMLWSMVDVVTNGNIPRNDEHNGANIISYNKTTGEFKVIYTAEKYTYFRMAVTFDDNVYFGSYSSNPNVEQYILKLDEDGNFTKVFRTRNSTSLRATCVYDEHLYFAGADEREIVEDGDGDPTKIAILQKSNEDDTVWNRVADYKDFGEYAYDPIMSSWAGCPVWELSTYKGYIYATLPSSNGFLIFRGKPDEGNKSANEYGWYWEEIVGLNNGINEPGLSEVKGGEPDTMRSLIGSTYVFNDELYAYNFDHGFGGEALAFAGVFQQIAGQDVKASDYLRYLYDSLHNPQKVWKFNDNTGEFEECEGFTNLVEGTTNEYVWRAGEYDGQMYITTMDAGVFYNYLTRLTNGSFFDMTEEEIKEQIGYINNLIELIIDEYDLDDKIDLDEIKEKLKDVIDMLDGIDTIEIDKESISEFLDKFSDIVSNLETTIGELKEEIENDGAEAVLQELMEKYELYDLIDKYINEENISALVDLLLNEEQKEDVINQVKSYLGIDEDVEISEEDLIMLATMFIKYKINETLVSGLEKIPEIYDKIDWEGLEMYMYISDMVRKDNWGFDLIRTKDGVNFELITDDGFGDKYNYGASSFLATDEGLYIGTCNPFYGGQLYLLTTGNEKKKDTNEYEIIEGANQIYNPESNEGQLTFRSNIEFDVFEKNGKVYVDDNEVGENFYNARKGSTIISFTDEFTNSLSDGEHSFKIAVTGEKEGEAVTSFTITRGENKGEEEDTPASKKNNPKTGDNITMWTNMMMVSLIGLAVTIMLLYKRK